MPELWTALTILGSLVIGYLLGSFPSAIFIGKVFYGIDVRTQGSHNAGGTNVGRVIGKKAGLITIALDVFKTIIAIWLVFFLIELTPIKDHIVSNMPLEITYYLTGLGCAIGHSFPLFAGFKGGKAMAVYAGFVLGTNWLFAILGVTFFLLVFYWKKYVSLSSILGVTFVFILSIAPAFVPEMRFGYWWFGKELHMEETYIYMIALFILASYVIIRHIPNIKRLLSHTEPHTKFKKTPSLEAAKSHENVENSENSTNSN